QVGSPNIAYDSTIIRSDDLDSSPPHWCNPATILANSGSCPTNSTTLAGDPPNWGTGSGVMFVNNQKTARIMAVMPANYQDDGVHCPTLEGSNSWVYIVTSSGDFTNDYLFRVPCVVFQNLNTSDWLAWDGATWTSTLTNAASIHLAGTVS